MSPEVRPKQTKTPILLILVFFVPQYCVTLTAGPEVCLLQSQLATGGAGLHSTACTWKPLPAGGVGQVSFTVLGLEPGEHTLTFTLKTRTGPVDVVKKTLRVVVRRANTRKLHLRAQCLENMSDPGGPPSFRHFCSLKVLLWRSQHHISVSLRFWTQTGPLQHFSSVLFDSSLVVFAAWRSETGGDFWRDTGPTGTLWWADSPVLVHKNLFHVLINRNVKRSNDLIQIRKCLVGLASARLSSSNSFSCFHHVDSKNLCSWSSAVLRPAPLNVWEGNVSSGSV